MKKINCILLVDDNAADNEYHKIIITQAGVCDHIKVALDGLKALEYIKNSAKKDQEKDYPKANLIFLDINMPRVNGFEFLEKYKNLDEKLKSEIVIVMLTTSLNPDDKKKAENFKEINSFIHKPLLIELLQEIVEKNF